MTREGKACVHHPCAAALCHQPQSQQLPCNCLLEAEWASPGNNEVIQTSGLPFPIYRVATFSSDLKPLLASAPAREMLRERLSPPVSLQRALAWTCPLQRYRISASGVETRRPVTAVCWQAAFLSFPSDLPSFPFLPTFRHVSIYWKTSEWRCPGWCYLVAGWQMLLLVAVVCSSSPRAPKGPLHHLLPPPCRSPHILLVLTRNIRVTLAKMMIIPCSWVMILYLPSGKRVTGY